MVKTAGETGPQQAEEQEIQRLEAELGTYGLAPSYAKTSTDDLDDASVLSGVPRLLYIDIETTIDVQSYKKKVKNQPVVYVFPGNPSHHRDDVTLFSIKRGGGLAEASQKIGEAGYPTLSLPTTGRLSRELVLKAMQDIYQAIGAGYSILLPVRTHQSQKSRTAMPSSAPSSMNLIFGKRAVGAGSTVQFFESDLRHRPGKEPAFWGGIDKNPNLPLANDYLEFLDNLADFMKVLAEKGEEAALQTLPDSDVYQFKMAYFNGQGMREDNNPWLQNPPPKSMATFSKEKNPTPSAPRDPLTTGIITAVKDAKSQYLKWQLNYYAGKNPQQRGPAGWFTGFRHTYLGGGRRKAMEFAQHMNKMQDKPPEELIKEINHFLMEPSTRYNNHSFASFLLDELCKKEDTPWFGIETEKTNQYHYSKDELISHIALKGK